MAVDKRTAQSLCNCLYNCFCHLSNLLHCNYKEHLFCEWPVDRQRLHLIFIAYVSNSILVSKSREWKLKLFVLGTRVGPSGRSGCTISTHKEHIPLGGTILEQWTGEHSSRPRWLRCCFLLSRHWGLCAGALVSLSIHLKLSALKYLELSSGNFANFARATAAFSWTTGR